MEITKISKKMEALASTSRLKIISLLSLRPFCVCELAQILNLAQPTLSRHLQKLEEAGFVKVKRHKFYNIYYLDLNDELNKSFYEILLAFLKKSPEFQELAEHPLVKASKQAFVATTISPSLPEKE
ncbi:MAG: ArsR/SmtB family transcription factor [Caldimicrobium sp.]